MILLYGHDKVVADWVSKKWGKSLNWSFAHGIIDQEGLLRGGILYHNYNGHNIEITYYGPGTFTVGIYREIAKFLINALPGFTHLTITVPRHNRRLIRSLIRLRIRHEGTLRHYYGPHNRDDAIVFGITKDEGKRFLRK